MNDNHAQHISQENLGGPLPLTALSHLSTCRFCQDELAGYVEDHELLKAPSSLKSAVLERAEKLDVKLIAGTNHVSKKLQLFYFSLKVGAAILCSLTLLVSAPGILKQMEITAVQTGFNVREAPKNQWSVYNKIENFTALFSPFEHTEVVHHDKQEK